MQKLNLKMEYNKEQRERVQVQFSIYEQLFCRNVKRFRGGLAFKGHRLLYHSIQGWRVIKKKKKKIRLEPPAAVEPAGNNLKHLKDFRPKMAQAKVKI